MESVGHVTVPLKVGGKKMRKRKELDALVAHSIAKRACSGKRNIAGNGIASHDQLLSQSTDDQEDYSWPKVRTNSRCRDKRLSCLKTCGPIIFGMCIVLSLGFMYWLYFDIRQQISDYRVRIEQVSATSQNVPDALQKWHETSKAIGSNQTILFDKIAQIQMELKNVSLELKQLKEQVDKKNENSQESQLTALKTSVATLGSKIENTVIDVNKLKDHYNEVEDQHKEMLTNITSMAKMFDDIKHISITPITADNLTQQSIENIKLTFNAQLNNLSTNVTSEISELKQQISWLENDGMKQKLELVKETTSHLSSQVSSIENFFEEAKLNSTMLNERVNLIQNYTLLLNKSLETVQNECHNYHAQNDKMFSDIDTIKSILKKEDTGKKTGVADNVKLTPNNNNAVADNNLSSTVIENTNIENKDLNNNNLSTVKPSSISPVASSSAPVPTSSKGAGNSILSASVPSPPSSSTTRPKSLNVLFKSNDEDISSMKKM